ncbi:hypothetical protein JCM10207_006307 [Rhodosporidiobolus poonsookiae]
MRADHLYLQSTWQRLSYSRRRAVMSSSAAPRHLVLAQRRVAGWRTTTAQQLAANAPVRRASHSAPAVATPLDHPSSSPLLSRRSAHHAALPSTKYDSTPPPPPAPSASSRPKQAAPSRTDPALAWEGDLADDFAAAMQSSLADAYMRQEDTRALHPEWEQHGRDALAGADDEVLLGVAVGETIEADDVAGLDEPLDWLDWRELLGGAAGVEMVEAVRPEDDLPASPDAARKAVEAASVDPPIREPSSAQPPPAPDAAPAVDAAPHSIPFAIPSAPLTKRRRGPFVLSPAERLSHTSLSPYVPLPAPTASSCTPSAPLEPHHSPLLSRHDWRLSSPLRRFLRSTPPPLWSQEETATLPLGHGRLVGVGVEAARIARKGTSREEEQWGWKVRVPAERERGEWEAADVYKQRMLRLLDLSRAADELAYQSSLLRSGTPSERESKGLTVCRATGVWLTDAARVEEVARLEPAQKEARRRREEGAGPKAVAEWGREDGAEIGEEQGYKFSENMVLRFTRAASHESALPPANSTGPQPPPGAKADGTGKWFVQGTLLEIREGRLVVAFDEVDMWQMGEDAYQIDIGLDGASYALQESALENLYLDPARQRARNASHVADLQGTFLQTGIASTPREWTLQGTELREIVVPPLKSAEKASFGVSAAAVAAPGSPAADIAHLPSPSASLAALDLPPSLSPTPADPAAALHPSDLLRSNQLIWSWIRRYSRPGLPMSMPGDPELGLNESQTRAIAMALGERLSLIQGPPGTGKSQTIVSLIALLKLHFRVPFPILLAAPTHVSVDHLLSLLVKAGLNPLRCGKASKVSSPAAEKWTIERRQEQHPLWERMERAREESEALRGELVAQREVVVESATQQKEADKTAFALEEKYRKAWRKFVMLEQKLYSSLLATADVFCATALGSGASKVLSMVDFPLVLLDEAAMCTEPVSLIPLMKGAQHATLIGDHKQLPAVVTSQEAKNERLHISLFERLLTTETVKSTLLDTQYRMRPDISAFPNLSFYHSALRDASVVSQRPPPPKSRFFADPADAPAVTSATAGPKPLPASSRLSASLTPLPTSAAPAEPIPVAFVSHDGEERLHRQSILNRTEANLIVEIVGDLLLRNPSLAASDIGIISPYYAQTRLLINTFESGYASSRLRGLLGAQRANEAHSVEVNTVDGFQGREKRVVVLSTVRANRAGQIGFLTDRRRLNVALTRARDALIVVGNQETLRRAATNEWAGAADPDADAGVWRRFLQWCDRRGLVREWREMKKDEQ